MSETDDEAIQLAQALEQRRALEIVQEAWNLGSRFRDNDAFRAGWDSACEEIEHRLRTEVWPMCLAPVDANKERGSS